LLLVLLPFSSTDISTTQNFPSGMHVELFWQKARNHKYVFDFLFAL